MDKLPSRANRYPATLEQHDEQQVQQILESLALSEADVAGKRLLDIGAGGGELVRWAQRHGAKAVAFDIDLPQRVRRRIESTGADVVEGDAVRLPFDDQSFDLVVSSFAIPHSTSSGEPVPGEDGEVFMERAHERRVASLQEAARVLKQGGQTRLGGVIRNERGVVFKNRSASIEKALDVLKTNPALEVQEELTAKDEQAGAGSLHDVWRIIIKKPVSE